MSKRTASDSVNPVTGLIRKSGRKMAYRDVLIEWNVQIVVPVAMGRKIRTHDYKFADAGVLNAAAMLHAQYPRAKVFVRDGHDCWTWKP